MWRGLFETGVGSGCPHGVVRLLGPGAGVVRRVLVWARLLPVCAMWRGLFRLCVAGWQSGWNVGLFQPGRREWQSGGVVRLFGPGVAGWLSTRGCKAVGTGCRVGTPGVSEGAPAAGARHVAWAVWAVRRGVAVQTGL